jgi:hypothetical protein
MRKNGTATQQPRQSPCSNSLLQRPFPLPILNSFWESQLETTLRIADVTGQASPDPVIEVPMGAGVTPLIPWPQEALTPPFFLAKDGSVWVCMDHS